MTYLAGTVHPTQVAAARAWAKAHGYFTRGWFRTRIYSHRGRWVADGWEPFAHRCQYVSWWSTQSGERVRARRIRREGAGWTAVDA